jgi:hypothetical protein
MTVHIPAPADTAAVVTTAATDGVVAAENNDRGQAMVNPCIYSEVKTLSITSESTLIRGPQMLYCER